MESVVVAAVRAALAEAGMAREGAALVCALSGGADSVALLRALLALRGETGLRLTCAHVEHGLRGADSLADADFARALCARHGVPLRLYHAGLSPTAPGVEARAREARYAALRDAMAATRADALLTAHHADDQLETVLMRLLRGGGASGLRGMPARAAFAGGLLLRPLLGVPGAALRADAAAWGEGWREDKTNAEPDALRNRVRLALRALPEREALRARTLDSAALLALEDDCLRAQAEALAAEALVTAPPCCYAAIAPLLAAPEALRLRALRMLYGAALAAVCAPAPEPPLTVSAFDAAGRPVPAYPAEGEGVQAVEEPREGFGEPQLPECNPSPATCAVGTEALRSNVSLHRSPAAKASVMRRQDVGANSPKWLCHFGELLRPRIPMPDERGLSYAQTRALEALLRAPAGASCNLPCGLLALRAEGRVHIVWQANRAPLYAASVAPLPLAELPLADPSPGRWAGWTLALTRASAADAAAAQAADPRDPDRLTFLLFPESARARLCLRLPQPGDRFRPLGAAGSKPLRRWLIDRKVDAPLRPFVPVLADGATLWWLPGLALGEAARLAPGERLLRLEARPGEPVLPSTHDKGEVP